MRIAALLLGSLLFLGCSSANKKIDEFADRACACTELECGKKVMEEFIGWAKDNSDARGDEDQAKKSFERMSTCISKLRTEMKDKDKDKAKADAPKDEPAKQ